MQLLQRRLRNGTEFAATDGKQGEQFRMPTLQEPGTPRTVKRAVTVEADNVALEGDLAIPEDARGIVAFAHGSGSSRHSSRNRFVAESLQSARLATLLFDLLTPEEESVDLRTAHLRFDMELLANRLIGAINWLDGRQDTQGLPIGLFGASTGGGAALMAAARHPENVDAVVSRGGRPDLAAEDLPRVRAATLLIVGARDEPVIELNELAQGRMTATVELVIVPGATHLFEEPGALDEVARLARQWFERHLIATRTRGAA
jgi:putative phosphoribosyl transferase